jgi:hypothetical protein
MLSVPFAAVVEAEGVLVLLKGRAGHAGQAVE